MNTTRHEFDRTDARGLIAIGVLGAALDLAERLVPAGLPYLAPYIFNAPIFAGTLLAAFWYGRGLARCETRPARWRILAFYAGVAAIYFVGQTRFEYAAQHMFFLNRVQQTTFGVFAPFLIAFSWPRDVLAAGVPAGLIRLCARPAARAVLRALRFPPVTIVVMLVTTDVWLIPVVNFASMINPPLYAFMNIAMILSGLLFWLVVLDPRPRAEAGYSFLTRMAAGFLPMFPQIAASSYIALTSTNLYNFYDLCGRLYPSVSPMKDQMLGGIIQWIPPGMLNTAVLFVLLHAVRKSEERQVADMPIPPGARVIEARWTGR